MSWIHFILLTMAIGMNAGADKVASAVHGEDPVCKAGNSAILQRTKLKFDPSYFARVFSNRKVAGVIIDSHTYLLDLETGKLKMVQGTYDPVPTPDGKFFVTIDRDGSRTLLYWLSSDVLDRPEPRGGYLSWRSKSFDLNYAYESLGDLGATGSKKNYRLLVDNDQGSIFFRDVSFNFKSEEDTAPHLDEGKWVKLCPGAKDLMKLPMISKDGKAVSLYNVKKGVTEIYDIDSHGGCQLNQSLPFQTGKADFSFDGKKVAFHMGRVPESSKWFKTANPKNRMDVFVYDLETKKTTRVSNTDEGNSYFPSFRKDGTLGFFVQEKDEKGIHYSYVLADPKLGTEMEAKFPIPEEDCKCDRNQFATMAALGTLRDQICGNVDATSLEAEALLPLSLEPEQCAAMVEKYWNDYKGAVVKRVATMKSVNHQRPSVAARAMEGLSHSDLTAVCPKTMAGVNRVKDVDSEKIDNSKNAPERLKTMCSQCHGGTNPPGKASFNLDNVLSMPMETRQAMAKKIEAGEMPPGGLNDDERKLLSGFLKTQ